MYTKYVQYVEKTRHQNVYMKAYIIKMLKIYKVSTKFNHLFWDGGSIKECTMGIKNVDMC